MLSDIKNLFEHKEKKENYKPVRVSNFQSKNHIEYESNGGRNKTVSVEEYLNKIRPYFKDIINNLKVQLTIGNNFTFAINNGEKSLIHSTSDNIEIMINDEADEVIK